MENKNEGNENKIILGYLNSTVGTMDRDDENKTKDLIDAVPIMPCQNSKLDNGLKDLFRRENPDSLEFTHYDRSFGNDPV